MKHYLLNILSMINIDNHLQPKFTYVLVSDSDIEEYRFKYKNHQYKILYSEIELSDRALQWFSLPDYNHYVKECNAVKYHTLESMKLCIPQTFDRVLKICLQTERRG